MWTCRRTGFQNLASHSLSPTPSHLLKRGLEKEILRLRKLYELYIAVG